MHTNRAKHQSEHANVRVIHITSLHREASDKASEKWSIPWYLSDASCYLFIVTITLIVFSYQWFGFGFDVPLWLGLGSILLGLGGTAADIITTHINTQPEPEFKQRKLYFPFVEVCPNIPEQPTLSDMLFHITTYVLISLSVLGYFFPAAGVAVGLLGLTVAFNNQYLRRPNGVKVASVSPTAR